jgi:hypothetical protein
VTAAAMAAAACMPATATAMAAAAAMAATAMLGDG